MVKRQAFTVVLVLLASDFVCGQPPGVVLRPGEMYVPGSMRDAFGNPISDGYSAQRPLIQQPDFSNPNVYDSGFQHQGYYIDHQSGRVIQDISRERIKDSALDANRNIVDPGSLRTIDRYERDRYGTLWRITGREWTSYGVPHSSLRRTRWAGRRSGVYQRLSDRVDTRITDEVHAVPQVDSSGRPLRRPSSRESQGSGGYMSRFE